MPVPNPNKPTDLRYLLTNFYFVIHYFSGSSTNPLVPARLWPRIVLSSIRRHGCARPTRLPCKNRCKFAPLFSITSKLLHPQPLWSQPFALLPRDGMGPLFHFTFPFSAVSSIRLIINYMRTLPSNGTIVTSFKSVPCPLFPMQRRGEGSLQASSFLLSAFYFLLFGRSHNARNPRT